MLPEEAVSVIEDNVLYQFIIGTVASESLIFLNDVEPPGEFQGN